MKPFFSIIIPLYNKANYITETLKTVINQTFTNFEIIIVNDGSTDNSIKRVTSFKDKRIKIINQKNQGAAAARNKGIDEAKSNLIVFLDADDLWFNNHLEELKNLYHDFPNCGMYCNRYKTKISKNKLVSNSYSNSIADDFRGVIPDYFEASLVNRVSFTSSIMVPREIIKTYHGFDINISSGQDLDLWTKIGIDHFVAISNKTTAIYRFEVADSLSKTSFLSKKLIDLNKFKAFERENKSLRKFIDIYRLEYAMQYRIAGDIKKSKNFISDIRSKIPLKTKILLHMPSYVLRLLLKIKHTLKRYGINITIYH